MDTEKQVHVAFNMSRGIFFWSTFYWFSLAVVLRSLPERGRSVTVPFSGFSPEIFEGMVAFCGVVKLGSITNVTQSATEHTV